MKSPPRPTFRSSQTGLWMTARRPESVECSGSVHGDRDGRRVAACSAPRKHGGVARNSLAPDMLAVLESTIELRVESREAIPRLAAWLADAHGVMFLRMRRRHCDRDACGADIARRGGGGPGRCLPGRRFQRPLCGAYQAPIRLTRCKLQMLRLADPGFKLPAAIMSDLGLGRYRGYSDLDAALSAQGASRHRAGRDISNMASILSWCKVPMAVLSWGQSSLCRARPIPSRAMKSMR